MRRRRLFSVLEYCLEAQTVWGNGSNTLRYDAYLTSDESLKKKNNKDLIYI